MNFQPLKFFFDPTSYLPSVNRRWLLAAAALVFAGAVFLEKHGAEHRTIATPVFVGLGLCMMVTFALAMTLVRRLEYSPFTRDWRALKAHVLPLAIALLPLLASPVLLVLDRPTSVSSAMPDLPSGTSSMSWHERDGRFYLSRNHGPDEEITETQYRELNWRMSRTFVVAIRLMSWFGLCMAWLAAFWPFGDAKALTRD